MDYAAHVDDNRPPQNNEDTEQLLTEGFKAHQIMTDRLIDKIRKMTTGPTDILGKGALSGMFETVTEANQLHAQLTGACEFLLQGDKYEEKLKRADRAQARLRRNLAVFGHTRRIPIRPTKIRNPPAQVSDGKERLSNLIGKLAEAEGATHIDGSKLAIHGRSRRAKQGKQIDKISALKEMDRRTKLATVLDTGASRHFIGDKELIREGTWRKSPIVVSVASGKLHLLDDEGDIEIRGKAGRRKCTVSFGKGHYWKGSKRNLISMSRLNQEGWKGVFEEGGGWISHPEGHRIPLILNENGLYELKFDQLTSDAALAAPVEAKVRRRSPRLANEQGDVTTHDDDQESDEDPPPAEAEHNNAPRRSSRLAVKTDTNSKNERPTAVEAEQEKEEPTAVEADQEESSTPTPKKGKEKASRSEQSDALLEKDGLATLKNSRDQNSTDRSHPNTKILNAHGWNEEVESRRREWLRIHSLLGHPSKRTTDHHMRNGTFGGTRTLPPEELKFCPICQRTKMGRTARRDGGKEEHSRREQRRAKECFEKIHIDLAGPFAENGIGQETHFMVIVDEHSNYTRVYPLTSKGDAYQKLIDYLKWIRTLGKKHDGARVERARLDRGSEFTNSWFKRVMLENGIQPEYSDVNHPNQNGKAERAVRTIKEISGCALNQAKAPISWWPFAVEYAADIHNRNRRYGYDMNGQWILKPLSPYELIHGTLTNSDFQKLKPWGSKVLKWTGKHKTFVDNGEEYRIIGFANETGGFKMISATTGKVASGNDITVAPMDLYSGIESRPTYTDDADLRRLANANKRRVGHVSTPGLAGTVPRRVSSMFDEIEDKVPRPERKWNPPKDGGSKALQEYIKSLPEASPTGNDLYTRDQARFINVKLKILQTPIAFDKTYVKGKQSIERWKKYNRATSVRQAATLGATSADLTYDIRRGLMKPGPGTKARSFREMFLDVPKPTKKGADGSVTENDDQIISDDEQEAEAAVNMATTHSDTIMGRELRRFHDRQHHTSTLEQIISEMEGRHCARASSVREDDLIEKAKTEIAAAAYHELQLGMVEPTTVPQARRTPQWKTGWEPAILKEKTSLERLNVFEVVPRSECRRPMDGKTVLKIKLNSDGSIDKFKARLVVRGFQQIEGVNYHQTNSPVVGYHTLRVLVSYATTLRPYGYKMYQWDVPTAYLHASLPEDEVLYMTIPEGMDTPDHPRTDFIWRLRKGLYGSKQGGRLWQRKMTTFLLNHGWVQAMSDDCLYIFHEGDEVAYLGVYVDDLNLVCRSDRIRKSFFAQLNKEFGIPMEDIDDEIEYLLGIKVTWDEDTQSTSLTQELAIDKLLAVAKMTDCSEKEIPMNANETLCKNEGAEDTSFPYRTVIGICLYLSQVTRPDIAFASSALSKYVSCPSSNHVKVAKHLVRYLKGTRTLGIRYYASGNEERSTKGTGHVNKNKIITYADAAYADDVDTRASTQGYVVLMNGGAVAWQATSQKWVTLSTTESEVAGCVSAMREVLGLRVLTRELGIEQPGSSIVWQDNQGAIYQQRGTKLQRKAKHYLIKLAWARDVINRGEVHVDYCTTDLMKADMFTKALHNTAFIRHRDSVLGGTAKQFITLSDNKTSMANIKSADQDNRQVEVLGHKLAASAGAADTIGAPLSNPKGATTTKHRQPSPRAKATAGAAQRTKRAAKRATAGITLKREGELRRRGGAVKPTGEGSTVAQANTAETRSVTKKRGRVDEGTCATPPKEACGSQAKTPERQGVRWTERRNKTTNITKRLRKLATERLISSGDKGAERRTTNLAPAATTSRSRSRGKRMISVMKGTTDTSEKGAADDLAH